MTNEPAPSLADEARFLHQCLFRKHGLVSQKVIDRYEAAHRTLFPDEHRERVARIVALRLDVEAVEFALRRRGACRELTRKIQILSFLVEVRADYRDEFITTRREPVRAILAVLSSIFGAGYKLLKGECLVRIHGLI